MTSTMLAAAFAAALFAAGSARAATNASETVAVRPVISSGTIAARQGAAPPVPTEARLRQGVSAETWHMACDGDARTFCAGAQDPSALSSCLDQRMDRLSPACRGARGGTKPGSPGDGPRR